MLNWRAPSFCLYTCLVLSAMCDAQSPQFSQMTDIAVSSIGQVYVSDTVSGSGVVYRLNSSLVQQESVQLSSGVSVIRLGLSPDEIRLVVCLSNGSCIAYDANNLANGPLGVFQNVLSNSNNVALVSAPVSGGGSSFYVGSSNGNVILIGQYGLDGTAGNVSRSSGNLFSVTASSFVRKWFGEFVAGNYTYFVVLDVMTSSIPGSRPAMRVLRVCDNSYDTSVAAMYEAEINCFSNLDVDANSALVGASLVQSFPNGGATLVIGLATPVATIISRVCTVGLSSIYTSLNNASCPATSLPWRSSSSPAQSCPTPCNIPPPGAVAVPSDMSNAAILVYSTTTTYTSTLAFNYESLALLFIAYTGPSLQAFNMTSTMPFSTWPMPGPVTKLTWTSGQNYVYAITITSVVQVPIEQCSNFTDCLSCAANVNPLCGWCTVEQKCSRRSQCQNSTVSTRWVQGGTSLCLSKTSVTPTKFVLETPSNISLSISSGLPPLLAGESFLCLLTTGSGVTISVLYLKVNQTTFRSNITGAISQLNVPKLVVYVGFGSSLLNIPFATGTLTAYNCPAATSCSSCLQSDGVCGWCNVEKRCTAVTSSCSNGISVNTTGGQTYLDVCPSLLNGTFLLPVAVSRGLVLNTKNLPPQFPGYQYLCSLQLPAISLLLPTSYISNTSIKCLFTAAQISLPVGTTAMVANISLIWTNSSTVMYPIDPLGVIQVTLYSCSALSVPVCTSCLAINIGTGYDCGWCNGISSCVEPETCSSTFANQSYLCPSPVLSSVTPTSGPFGGGTNLIITGTNLGEKVGDIVNVAIWGVSCVVQSYGYIPGIQVMCVTGAYISGGTSVNVVMTINRSGTMATAQSNFQYTYVKPSISSVFPKSGPMSGGTNVVIGGMFLNVGNGVKAVLLNGAVCVILQSSLTQVTCTSSAQNVTGVGLVTVYIDNEVTTNNGVTFEYTNNPNYTSVSPASTIPAGGIILTFNGTYLNVTQKAYLKAINGKMEGCNQTFTTLQCIAPPLGSYLSGPGVSLFNYTIVMDGAPGPNLAIGVAPNPVFTSINTNDITQVVGSVKVIRINGMNIMSVNVLSEIVVTVGGGRCTIDLGTTTDTVLSCQPQNVSTSSSKKRQSSNGLVVVSVGRFLSYTPGSIMFVTSTVSPFPVATVAGGVAGGVAGLLLFMAVIMASIVVVYRRDSVKKRYQIDVLMSQVRAHEKDTKEMKDPSSFTGGHSITDFLSQYAGTIISSDQIHVLNTVGEGEFGVVYKAHLLQVNTLAEPQVVAVKTLKGLFTKNDLTSMMDEILKMQDFHHPHVMTLIGVSFDANHTPTMVMPFMANGCLLSYLKKNRASLLIPDTADEETLCISQKVLTKMCYQVALGMEYLAGKKFVHRDLAARNCMIDGDGVIKVGDFGLSEDVYRTGYFRLDKGSSGVRLPFKWLAPESIQDGVFNEKTDVWSYGVTCWEVFTCGKLPYAGVDPCDLPKFLQRGRRLEKPENAACPETMYTLMLKCWDSDPEDRPSFTKIGSTISRALETMSGYLDISLVSDEAKVVAEGHGLEGERIETVTCEAYKFNYSNDIREQVSNSAPQMSMGTDGQYAQVDRIETFQCGAYNVNPREGVVTEHPVPDDCGEYTVMGVVPEEAQEYMVPTAAYEVVNK